MTEFICSKNTQETYDDIIIENCFINSAAKHKRIITEAIRIRSESKINDIMGKRKFSTREYIFEFFVDIFYELIVCGKNDDSLWLLQCILGNDGIGWKIYIIKIMILEKLYLNGMLNALVKNTWILKVIYWDNDYFKNFLSQTVMILEIINYIVIHIIPIDIDSSEDHDTTKDHDNPWHFLQTVISHDSNLIENIIQIFINHGKHQHIVNKLAAWYDDMTLKGSNIPKILDQLLRHSIDPPTELIGFIIVDQNTDALELLVKYNVDIKKASLHYNYKNDDKKKYSDLLHQAGLSLEEYLRIHAGF